MTHRQWRTAKPRSALASIAFAVKIVLIGVLAVWALLSATEVPVVANILAGLGPDRPLVGIIAGHWQNDSGAVCDDGLEEVDVNLEVARRVGDLLRNEGYRVEVLPEYSQWLNGYRADVFLAIHSDSCIEDLSGFKVARMTHALEPEREDRLVELLYQEYGRATGLQPHLNTITDDMRLYHALRQIAPETPGAIIECGFLGGDRYLLTQEQDRVAVGIANGLSAFLREQAEATPTSE
ncbi:MAG: N-acetylmuramoyl-L-alanine amidase [Anaerolineae bacterium]